MEMTPLHSALISGDFEMFENILNALQNQEFSRLVLNTALVSLEQQKDRIRLVPPKLIYLSYIAHVLTPQERQQIDKQMNYLDGIPEGRDIVSRMEQGLHFELALSLACASGNHRIVRSMISKGTALTASDSKSENIIHSLVRLSEIAPKRAVEMYHLIIDDICDLQNKKILLRSENIQGKRPLDLAGKLGVPEMIKTIINTNGVYKEVLMDYGLISVIRYDITDYESKQARTHTSLLYRLTDFDEHQLNRAQACSLFSSEPFNTWIQVKFKSRRNLTITFVVYWLVLVLTFFLNSTIYILRGEFSLGMLCMPVAMALAYLAVEVSHSRANIREVLLSLEGFLRRGHIPVTFTFAYRCFQILFACLVVLTALAYIFICRYPDIVLCILAISNLIGMFSLLFFFQLQSQFGHLLIVLQKIVSDTLFFFVMMFLIYVAFALSFYLLHADLGGFDSVLKADGPCPSGPFLERMYLTIMFMFTIMAPADIMFKCAKIPELGIVLYVLLLVIISIVLVNLLIAIMTRRIDEISRMKDDMLKLERMSIILYMEERVKTKIAIVGFKYFDRIVNKLRRSCCSSKVNRNVKEVINGNSFVEKEKGKAGKVYLCIVQERMVQET